MNFTRIKTGFSQNRRIPILGKIRLGVKVQKAKPTGETYEHPIDLDHFVVPPEVAQVYGETPKELDIMFASDDQEQIFPQFLAWFGKSTGLKCKGDMETAVRLNDETGEWIARSCPCEHYKSKANPKGECVENGILLPLLPRVSMSGAYQIKTGSYHSVVDVNSALDYIRGVVGRIFMVPLKLKRVERKTHKGNNTKHYTLKLELDANIDEIADIRRNESLRTYSRELVMADPTMTNPVMDKPDLAEHEDTGAREPFAEAYQHVLGPVIKDDEPKPIKDDEPKPIKDDEPKPIKDDEPKPSEFIWSIGKVHNKKKISKIPDEYLDWYVLNGNNKEHLDATLAELAKRQTRCLA